MPIAAVKTQTRFENILFATDFSAAAEQAVPYVKNLVKRYESKLVALHVRAPIVNPMTQPGTWAIDLEAAKAADEQHCKQLEAMFAGVPTKALVEEGDIQSVVEDVIKDNNVDLMVIGTRGRTGVGKFFLGSVAEELFRKIPCPVLTVGPHVAAERGAKGEFRKILYATDLSPESKRAAAYAISLAQEFEAELMLVHVVPEPNGDELASMPEVDASLMQILRKFMSADAETWCRPEFFVDHGDPAERILHLANLRGADLIVLGTQAEKGFPGAATHLPIATAHKVVTQAACPVLTIRH